MYRTIVPEAVGQWMSEACLEVDGSGHGSLTNFNIRAELGDGFSDLKSEHLGAFVHRDGRGYHYLMYPLVNTGFF